MDPRSGYARGCLRTLDEIAAWSVLDADGEEVSAGDAAFASSRAAGFAAMIADWYFDFVLPVCLFAERAARLTRAAHHDPLPAGAVGRAAGRERPERPSRDPGETRVHVSLRDLAGEESGDKAQVPAGASVQSVAAFASRGSRATAPRTRCIASSVSSGPMGASPTCPSNGRSLSMISTFPMPSPNRVPDVKDALRRNTDEAIARGVFGVPTLALGDALFWGADATAMAADYAAAGCRYTDPEYARVAALPVGAERKEPTQPGKRKTPIVGTAQ